MEDNFLSKLAQAADKIEEIISKEKELNSWDIKLRLKMSASLLYLALGYLSALGKIDIAAEDLNYTVRLKNNS